MRRGTLFLLCATVLFAGVGGRPLQADDGLPIDIDQQAECGGFVPHAPLDVTRGTITANIVVALDGVSLARAKEIVAKGSKPYGPGLVPQITPDVKINVIAYHDLTGKLHGDSVRGPEVSDLPEGPDLMSQLIRYYRLNHPDLKRHHVHLLTTRDIALDVPPVPKEYAAAGIANCIGGVGTKYAYAITEVGTIDAPTEFGPLVMHTDVEAKNFAHEMGHVFGGQHHYAECIAAAATSLAARRGDLCSVMFNALDFIDLHFSAVEAAAIRGFVEAHIAGTNPLPAKLGSR